MPEITLKAKVLSPSTCSLTGVDCSALGGRPIKELILPTSVTIDGKEYIVTEIGSCFMRMETDRPHYASLHGVTSITLPQQLRSIEALAFYNCGSLKSITLPDTLKTIGTQAFYKCKSLPLPALPPKLSQIGFMAFKGIKANPKDKPPVLVLPSTLTAIGSEPFGVLLFKSIKASVKVWRQLMMHHFDIRIRHFAPAQGIREVPDHLFCFNEYLQSLTLPKSCATVGVQAFYNCHALQQLSLGQVETIHAEAFGHTSVLNNLVVLPSSLTKIGNRAFSHASDPENVRGVILPKPAESGPKVKYGVNVFADNKGLQVMGTDAAIAMAAASPGALNGTKIKKMTIPEGAKEIDVHDCSELEELVLPSTARIITRISECPKLKKICLPSGIESVAPKAFFNMRAPIEASPQAWKVLMNSPRALYGYSCPYIIVPEGVTGIPNHAFLNCRCLRLDLPQSVRRIYPDALVGCHELKTLIIKSGMYLQPEIYNRLDNLRVLQLPGQPRSIITEERAECAAPPQLIEYDADAYCSASFILEISPEEAEDITNSAEAAECLRHAVQSLSPALRIGFFDYDCNHDRSMLCGIDDDGKYYPLPPAGMPEWLMPLAYLQASKLNADSPADVAAATACVLDSVSRKCPILATSLSPDKIYVIAVTKTFMNFTFDTNNNRYCDTIFLNTNMLDFPIAECDNLRVYPLKCISFRYARFLNDIKYSVLHRGVTKELPDLMVGGVTFVPCFTNSDRLQEILDRIVADLKEN